MGGCRFGVELPQLGLFHRQQSVVRGQRAVKFPGIFERTGHAKGSSGLSLR